MLYERIEITDYQEDSIEPISTDECRVRLELSGTPPKAWRKIFKRLIRSPTAQQPGGIGKRVSLLKNGMTLTTTGEDIMAMRTASSIGSCCSRSILSRRVSPSTYGIT